MGSTKGDKSGDGSDGLQPAMDLELTLVVVIGSISKNLYKHT
jgi:hypothetical protein